MKKRDNKYASHSNNISTRSVLPCSSICGLKGAVKTSTNGASYISLLWDAGNLAVPFCISGCLKLLAFKQKFMSNWFKYDGVVGSGETSPKEQIKCPSCGSYKTMPYSAKSVSKIGGIGGILIGFIMTMFFLWIIGIPMIVVGIIMLLSSFTVKETGAMKCNACGFEFKK